MRNCYFTAALMAGTALGLSSVAAAQEAAPPSTQGEDVPAIVVTGLRASLQTSAQIKKNAAEVIDSITATDIGKLPDPNVAETLTRIPGVQAYRFGGEAASPTGNGSGLTIRGLTGQTGSRVDGRSYFTAGVVSSTSKAPALAWLAGSMSTRTLRPIISRARSVAWSTSARVARSISRVFRFPARSGALERSGPQA
jgi:outer membrane receptor for ferrienterochelin and colicin